MTNSDMGLRKAGVGTAWMVAASLFYGATSISAKMSVTYLTTWQTAMGRFLLGALLIPFIARFFRLNLLGQNRRLLFLRGICATGAFLCIIQSFKTVPISVTMVLFYLWPVFSCLLSPWVAGESISWKEWAFVFGAVVGAVIILAPDKAGPGLNAGHFFALASSLLGGLAIILIRRLGRTNNPFTIYFYFCVMGVVLCLGPLLSQGPALVPASGAAWSGLIAVAVFSMAAQVLMNQGMKHLNAAQTGALMMIEVLVAATFGVVYLDESISLRLLCGSGLILGSGFALMVRPGKAVKK